MKYYKESARELPISYEVDVLVCGSGPAGIGAALASARSGAKTLIIESLGDLGGISTSGLMSHWTGRSKSPIYLEILRRSAEKNEGELHGKIVNTIDPEKLKTLYLEMLTEAGAEILLYTFASDVIVEDGTVKGVIIENKTGRSVISAKVVIDATGDGDIAFKSGAEYIKGRESDGRMQPCTIMFKVGGVDLERAVFPGSFETLVNTEKGELQALGKEIIGHPAGHVLLYKSTLPGIVTCNMTNCIDIDGTKAEDLTRATLTCREQIDRIVKFLREYAPGYENCYCISSASLMGIRETRHFKGVYTLTEDDIMNAVQFEDWIVLDAHFNFDIHNLDGAGLDKDGVQHEFKQMTGYTVPYRCLVPERVNGLLLAGRCISGTHKAHSNFRVMPICVGIGEGAGYAAAIAVKKNILPRDVEAKEIQKYILKKAFK
ncbi:MAG: FAD-dependent oxidoreductase [Clostridia bacterium]|nr:FAD-dependent oxidoreductase [Clostridia bacterium]